MRRSASAPTWRWSADRAGSRLLVWLPATVLGGALAIPVAYLVARAVGADTDVVADVLLRSRNVRLFANTVALSAAVLATASLIALPTAWISVRARVRFPGLVTLLAVLPLALPGYVLAFVLLAAGGPFGAVAEWTGLVFPRVSGFGGATWALALYTSPYLFLNLRTAMLGMDPAREDAARLLGAGPREVILRIVLPALRPAYLSGALLVCLHVIGDFGVVSLMRFETLSYALYLQYAAAFDRTYAAWIGLGLLVLTASLLLLERYLSGPGATADSRPIRRSDRIPLGGWTVPAVGLLAVLAVQTVLLPVGTLTYWALQAGPAPWSDLLSSVWHTVSVSLPAAGVAVVAALPVAYASARSRLASARLPERIAWLSYAVPPLALALALVFFSLRTVPAIYQTAGLLVAAYVMHFLVEAVGPLRTGLLQASPRLPEAARSLGRSGFSAFAGSTLPLLKPGLAAGAALVFLSAAKELPLTFLLSPAGFDTLALNVWSYTSEAAYGGAAPYALAVVLLSVGFIGLVLARVRVVSSHA